MADTVSPNQNKTMASKAFAPKNRSVRTERFLLSMLLLQKENAAVINRIDNVMAIYQQ